MMNARKKNKPIRTLTKEIVNSKDSKNIPGPKDSEIIKELGQETVGKNLDKILKKEGITDMSKMSEQKKSNVVDALNKEFAKGIKGLSCKKRDGIDSELCELGGKCELGTDGKCTNPKSLYKRLKNFRPFEGQDLPFVGSDCNECDEKGTFCNHTLVGLVATISFIVFGSMLIAFGVELNGKIKEEEDDWKVMGNVFIGLGSSYIIIALGILFFTLFCPEGSDWGDASNDRWKGIVVASIILILSIGSSIFFPCVEIFDIPDEAKYGLIGAICLLVLGTLVGTLYYSRSG